MKALLNNHKKAYDLNISESFFIDPIQSLIEEKLKELKEADAIAVIKRLPFLLTRVIYEIEDSLPKLANMLRERYLEVFNILTIEWQQGPSYLQLKYGFNFNNLKPELGPLNLTLNALSYVSPIPGSSKLLKVKTLLETEEMASMRLFGFAADLEEFIKEFREVMLKCWLTGEEPFLNHLARKSMPLFHHKVNFRWLNYDEGWITDMCDFIEKENHLNFDAVIGLLVSLDHDFEPRELKAAESELVYQIENIRLCKSI